MYGGQQSWIQPSVEFGGRVGQIDYYVTGEFLHNTIGIENPTSSFNAIHDLSNQPRGFAYVSGIIDPTTRLTAILGASRSQFQIPQHPEPHTRSRAHRQRHQRFPVGRLQPEPASDQQFRDRHVAEAGRRHRFPDRRLQPVQQRLFLARRPDSATILFNGIAQTAYRRSSATGTQGDGSWRISPEHTVRSGFYIQGERSPFSTTSDVLPVDDMGMQTSDQPLSIFDSGGKTGWLYSYYLQDEWKIVPTVTVNFGARFDLIDEFAHEHQLSPRVNVVWQPTETTTFTAGYSRYFVPPPFELVASRRSVSSPTRPPRRPSLKTRRSKAERDHYFDVGASQIILPGLKVGVDAYYKIANNLLDEGQFGAPILLTPVQLPQRDRQRRRS